MKYKVGTLLRYRNCEDIQRVKEVYTNDKTYILETVSPGYGFSLGHISKYDFEFIHSEIAWKAIERKEHLPEWF